MRRDEMKKNKQKMFLLLSGYFPNLPPILCRLRLSGFMLVKK